MSRIHTIDDARALAKVALGFTHWLDHEVIVNGYDSWIIRASAKAFDYYGAVFVRAGDVVASKAQELEGLVEQMQECLVSGYAPLREGYPKRPEDPDTVMLELRPGESREVDGVTCVCTEDGNRFAMNTEDFKRLQERQ